MKTYKICSRCKENKLVSEFFLVNPSKNEFLRGECKICTRLYKRIWAGKNREKFRLYAKKNYHLHRDERLKKMKLFQKNNPEKTYAHSQVQLAILRGDLIKVKICSICGNKVKKIEGHHDDYSKPLKVRWLCRKCHAGVHQFKS